MTERALLDRPKDRTFPSPRIHADATAAALARRHGARAVTIGRHVFFGTGEYAPASPRGDWLIAHETAHVAQQTALPGTASAATPLSPAAAERQASAYADRALTGGPLPDPGRSPARAPQCQPVDSGSPIPMAPWNVNGLSITVTSAKSDPRDAWGFVMPGVHRPFSKDGMIRSFCVTPARYPLEILFHADADIIPRPTPFTPPAVSASLAFRAAGGAASPAAVNVADAKPVYEGPGQPLKTNFGRVVSVDSGADGMLGVTAALQDPDSNTTLQYTDTIECRLDPCA